MSNRAAADDSRYIVSGIYNHKCIENPSPDNLSKDYQLSGHPINHVNQLPRMSMKAEAPVTSEIVQQADKHHGLPLLPHPSEDVKDPLRWSRGVKLASLFATSFFNFTANFAGAGLSVATVILEHQFNKTPNQVNSLLTVRLKSLTNDVYLG